MTTTVPRATIISIATLIALVGIAPSSAPAAADPLPECVTIDTLNCQGTFVNVYAGGLFHQTVNGSVRTEPFWPFRNPMVDAHDALTDPDAFPADYVTAKLLYASCITDEAALQDRAHRKIRHLRDEVRRLRARLAD